MHHIRISGYTHIRYSSGYADTVKQLLEDIQYASLRNRKDPMQNEIQLFKALSDSTRLRILLLLLNNGELCVCDLMESMQIPQSTASRHLALLRNAGFVDGERRGTWMYYRVVEDQKLGSAILHALKKHCSRLENAQQDQERCLKFLSTKDNIPCQKTTHQQRQSP